MCLSPPLQLSFVALCPLLSTFVSQVERRKSELLCVGLPGLRRERGCKGKTVTTLKMVYYSELSVWVSQGPFLNKEIEGKLPVARLPVPKEVNCKKMKRLMLDP